MASAQPALDTADRSLAHWSEAGRREMEAFYALARLDYRLLAESLDWAALLAQLHDDAGGELTLLDVACGSGKFPEAMLALDRLVTEPSIAYDLLDPSAFSIREAAGALAPPFRERARLETTLEDLDPNAGPWDVVWATHALYALDPAHLTDAVKRFRAARAPGGFSFLAQGAAAGHYLRVYAAYLAGVRGGEGTQYVSSDDLIAELQAQGEIPVVQRLSYDHVIAADQATLLEGYLQRCLFDDTLSLAQMREAPVLGAYIEDQLDHDAGVYRFHHEVDCVVLTPNAGGIPWTAAS